MKPIRVVLVEDNDVFREALELLLGLSPHVEVVGSAAEGAAAVTLCRRLDPDVLLIDYRLPGDDGIQVTSAVRRECPKVAVVCLTASVNEREIEALFTAGAVDCVKKDQPLDTLVAAIRRAVPGGVTARAVGE